ncbi:MAG: cyclic 2,3-diphosphoglycerate synthase [Actinomycetota bacterium]
MGRRILIMGAAGRDFHNFNVVYRDDPSVEVVAFTATQIPFIDRRTYPKQLAGARYPRGIPIHPEEDLPQLIHDLHVDEVVFAYSDVSYDYVMHRASIVATAGASFTLLGPDVTMLTADVPVVAVCASRTGAGKSQTSRAVARILSAADVRAVVVRHPMPYGNLLAERVQRFASRADLDEAGVTIEEREEYEPHIAAGTTVFAGVDYGAILTAAEEEADVIIWDGGNNDLPFFRPTLHITVVDPLRPGDEVSYYPGEINVRMADVIVVNKIDVADLASIEQVERTVCAINPRARIVMARSPLEVDDPGAIRGKRVLVVEDGPTLTHGDMKFGAGIVAAREHGAAEIVDPRPYAVGSLEDVYRRYDVGPVLPAMGYSPEQLSEMEKMIADSDCELVVIATPIDLRHVVPIAKPTVRVSYELQVAGTPTLADVLAPVIGEARSPVADAS